MPRPDGSRPPDPPARSAWMDRHRALLAAVEAGDQPVWFRASVGTRIAFVQICAATGETADALLARLIQAEADRLEETRDAST